MGFIRRNTRPGLTTYRIEAFSDGVFAISVTLLVLTIAIPNLSPEQISQGLLFKNLLMLWPKFLSYFISFIVIGIFWVGHIIMFNFIKRSDRILVYLNTILLLFVSFIPFPAALIGQYGTDKSAVMLYGIILMLLGFVYLATWMYASNNHRLIDSEIKPEIIKKGMYVVAVAPTLYFIAILFALVNPVIAAGIYVIIPVIYLIPSPIDDFVDYNFQQENKS